MAKRRPRSVLDIPVDFGSVSIQAKSVRVPVKIQRADMSLDQADQILCGHRLTGKIVARPKGDHQDQGTLNGFEPVELPGVFEVGSFGVHSDYFSASLNFNKEDVSLDELGEFAVKPGRLIVQEVGELEDGEPLLHSIEDDAGPEE